jgi:hypothetical protein
MKKSNNMFGLALQNGCSPAFFAHFAEGGK